MKTNKFLAIVALAVATWLSATCFAQQALSGKAPTVSPEIHDDNTVTFHLVAPSAEKVQIAGDFPYSFRVDGLKVLDPSNVYLLRDVASVTNILTVYTPAGYETSEEHIWKNWRIYLSEFAPLLF